MSKLALAISIVSKAFESKVDKGGKPYVLHCLRVMNGVDQSDEDLMIASVMHDLIEDCEEYTFEMIAELGFSERVITILRLLTHKKEVSYDDYIKMISFNKDATEIKLADLRDNSDITRIKDLRKKDFDRMEKYHRAYKYLSDLHK